MKTVLITGAEGNIGTRLRGNLAEKYELRSLTGDPVAGLESLAADVADLDAILPAFAGIDAVVHLAASPDVDTPWPDVLHNNVEGTYNVFEASRRAGVKQVVFASSNHAVGMFEVDSLPALYRRASGVMVDEHVPVRPDNLYGVSKSLWRGARPLLQRAARAERVLPAHRLGVAQRRPDVAGKRPNPELVACGVKHDRRAPAPLRRHLVQPRRPRPADRRLPAGGADPLWNLLRCLG